MYCLAGYHSCRYNKLKNITLKLQKRYMKFIKKIIRLLLIFFKLDLTKNLKYDRLTAKVMKRVIQKNTNCIDIGCHKGEMLTQMLALAPDGTHFAFEPIPEMYQQLEENYGKQVSVFPYAVSDQKGTASFQFVKNLPAYSGLKRRKYAIANPDIEEINVELVTLDTIIPKNIKIGFIKIDVEGAEFSVLKGASELLKRDAPTVVFEFGLGASDFYDTSPDALYRFAQSLNMDIYTLDHFLKRKSALQETEFCEHYKTNHEYYFILARV